jgi:hypothetical protein
MEVISASRKACCLGVCSVHLPKPRLCKRMMNSSPTASSPLRATTSCPSTPSSAFLRFWWFYDSGTIEYRTRVQNERCSSALACTTLTCHSYWAQCRLPGPLAAYWSTLLPAAVTGQHSQTSSPSGASRTAAESSGCPRPLKPHTGARC